MFIKTFRSQDGRQASIFNLYLAQTGGTKSKFRPIHALYDHEKEEFAWLVSDGKSESTVTTRLKASHSSAPSFPPSRQPQVFPLLPGSPKSSSSLPAAPSLPPPSRQPQVFLFPVPSPKSSFLRAAPSLPPGSPKSSFLPAPPSLPPSRLPQVFLLPGSPKSFSFPAAPSLPSSRKAPCLPSCLPSSRQPQVFLPTGCPKSSSFPASPSLPSFRQPQVFLLCAWLQTH